MKKTLTLVVLSLVLTLNFACKKKDAATTDSGSGTSSKATLSAWNIANSSFAVRLDLNSANLSGNSFTMIIKCSDTTELWCPSTMLTGQEDSGTYNITGTCVDHGGMSTSYLGVFETGGVGSYTNDGTTLTLCKHNGSCLSYH